MFKDRCPFSHCPHCGRGNSTETEASKGGTGSGDAEPHSPCLHAEPAASRREVSGKLRERG